jgi:hypothetical protein
MTDRLSLSPRIDLAGEVTRKFPKLPIVLMSGYSDAIPAAGNRFLILRKPFELSALERAIQDSIVRFDHAT